MISSKLIHFLDNKSILGRIISQNSGYYPTKDKKVIGKLDRIFIFEKIKKLSIALGQGLGSKAHQANRDKERREREKRKNLIRTAPWRQKNKIKFPFIHNITMYYVVV